MNLTIPSECVFDADGVPEYDWETYQRGFLGILNNAYNQSCNAGTPVLGKMNDIETSFVEDAGSGSYQDFVRYYVREHDGHDRARRAVRKMADNLQSRVEAIGGAVPIDDVRFWSRKYVWYMLTNTYRGFCSERTAIHVVASHLDLPFTVDGDEPSGIDGTVGDATVQVKPASYLGIDLNDHDADYVITYEHDADEDVFAFEVPDELTPRS